MPDEPPVPKCSCRCHQSALGDMRDAFLRGAYSEGFAITKRIDINWEGIDVTSALEAAAACKGCIDRHCLALLPEKPPPKRKTPWVDPPLGPETQGPPMPTTDPEDGD